MTCRSLTSLDFTNLTTNKMSKKNSKFALVDLQQVTYVPAQPVLSCRTVDIDLPGTRTYRQKSSLDILEEHRRLIKNFYKKPRISTSAPPRENRVPSSRPPSENSIGKVHIEVKGRPLTSGTPMSSYVPPTQNNSTENSRRRPKTAGHLKHIRPLTDCYLVLTEDRDLLAVTQSNQELSNKLKTYWKSEKNTLATGKFMRGQKYLDVINPTLNSWLTFGGSAGAHSDGVIDAFANFKNSEGYYNIEGSVGSRVAKQLQKGDTIRIGINGILKAQDLKVNKRQNGNTSVAESHLVHGDEILDVDEKDHEALHLQKKESEMALRIPVGESTKEEMLESHGVKNVKNEANDQSSDSSSDHEFTELTISALDDFEENVMGIEVKKHVGSNRSEMVQDEDVDSPVSNDDAISEAVKLTTPLSWTDQCSKSDIKIIHARTVNKEVQKPVASETFPIKFDKLIDGILRPKLTEVVSSGYKLKQRSADTYNNKGASKVKVIYMDPLTTKEEETVQSLSIENIISHRLKGGNQENTTVSVAPRNDNSQKNTITNIKNDIPVQSQRSKSTRREPRNNPPHSTSSWSGERVSYHSPQFKVTPVRSLSSNLRTNKTGINISEASKAVFKTARPSGKLILSKPLHRVVAGPGSSIKSDMQQGETEFIKITSQLQISPISAQVTSQQHRSAAFNISQMSPRRRIPQDLDFQVVDKIQLERRDNDDTIPTEVELSITNSILYTHKIIPAFVNDPKENVDENCNNKESVDDPEEPESSTSIAVPISIPTADDDSFCQSNSAYGTNNDITVKNREELDNAGEYIDKTNISIETR